MDYTSMTKLILATFSLLLLSSLGWSQSIFINQVPAYSSLPSCAESPLSTIVRDMVNGCGDGGETTSFDCFCTSSSARFSSIIASKVADNCGDEETEGAADALDVFSEYCELDLGATGTVPALTTANNVTTPTSSPTESASRSNGTALLPSGSITPAPPPTTIEGPASTSISSEPESQSTAGASNINGRLGLGYGAIAGVLLIVGRVISV